jgi:hypothetical protein
MSLSDIFLLCKRAVVESVIGEHKNICQIDHFRHRSFINIIVNWFCWDLLHLKK